MGPKKLVRGGRLVSKHGGRLGPQTSNHTHIPIYISTTNLSQMHGYSRDSVRRQVHPVIT